jgi:hypothetical protein
MVHLRPCKLIRSSDAEMSFWGPSREHTFHATEEIKPHLCTDTPPPSIYIPAMCAMIVEQPSSSANLKDWRRRSADVGGLHLATENSGQGQGWMGGHPGQIEYAIRSLNPIYLLIKVDAQNYVCRDAKRYVYRNIKFSQREQPRNVRVYSPSLCISLDKPQYPNQSSRICTITAHTFTGSLVF